MSELWWQKPVRMMRVDYTPDLSIVKDEDLDQMAESRKTQWRINCEWIVGTPGFAGKGYQTTFHANGFERYLGFEDFDYLRAYTPHAHRHGIRVLAYLNAHWYDYSFGDAHQDWEQVQSDRKHYGREHPLYGDGTTFCVNSAWRDWAFQLICEAMKTGIDGVFLDGPVIFPDCCYCAACQQQFSAKYGTPIPQEDWRNPAWQQFLDFREDSMARFLADAQDHVRAVNPQGVIFLNASSWSPGAWRVARDNQKMAPHQTFNGTESFFYYAAAPGERNIYDSLLTGKFLRAVELPAVLFTHYMNGNWHYRNLPPQEMKLAMVQTLAANVNPWLALMNPALEYQPDSYKPVNEIFGFHEDHESYFVGTTPMADVGLFLSKRTGRTYISRWEQLSKQTGMGREENLIVDMQQKTLDDLRDRKQQSESLLHQSFTGSFYALTQAHIPFDIVLDRQLDLDKLNRFKVLVLPDAACLSKQEIQAIRIFVQNGGNLVTSFEAGHYDENGQDSTEMFDLLGIEQIVGAFPVMFGENYAKAVQDTFGVKEGALLERGAYALQVKAQPDASTSLFFLEPIAGSYKPLTDLSSFPAMIERQYGQGRVVYFPEAIAQFIGCTKMPSAVTRFTQAVKSLIDQPMLDVRAPKTVSVEMYRQDTPKRILIHLVNNTVDGRPVNEFLPVNDLTLNLRLNQRPRAVSALRENDDIQWSFASDKLTIDQIRLTTYDVIVVEL